MASRLLNPALFHIRAPLFAATVGVSAGLLFQQYRSTHILRLDSSPSSTSAKDWSFNQYQNEARTPVFTSRGGLNPRAVRQLSAGSIIGLVAGLGLSIFSKSLVVLLGMVIVGVQTAESYGIHLIPYRWLQGYFKNINIQSAVQDNVAFKISFGMMFALSAFAEL